MIAGSLFLSAPLPARAQSGSHRVDMDGFAFSKRHLRIRTDDIVVWFNSDIVPHTATAVDGAWDSGQIDPGGSAAITFRTAGRFPYLCTFHPSMQAVLEVEV